MLYVLKNLAFVAFVRSGVEYASIIWDPHFIKTVMCWRESRGGLLAGS